MIIAICGGDAVGKATQSKILAERLHGTRFTFPEYSTPAGKAILGHLKKEWSARGFTYGDMDHPDEWRDPAQPDALVFQALQTVNRLELLPQIMEALTRGPVVFDRYTASGLVYGGLDGLDPKWIELVNASLPEPDLWILLDAPVAVGFERRPERRDRIESNREYLEKVRTGYLELFNSKQMKQIEEGVHVDNFSWRMVSAIGTIDEVAARIWDVTSKRISPSPGRAA